MTWNYRILDRGENHDPEARFAVFEVFYDEKGKVKGWTEQPTALEAPTPEGLAEELERIRKAFELPVLIEAEL